MVIVDEARGVGLGLGKEREKWDTLTRGGSRFLVMEEDVSFAEGSRPSRRPYEGVWHGFFF